MFDGFTDGTFEFYMAIRFNNNRAFFQENHDWYVKQVREKMYALCEALAPTVSDIDPTVDLRPARCVARVNRDVRFSKDKSPYRDYSFLKFRRPGGDLPTMLGMYFDLSDDGASYGMGIYDRNVPLMRGLSRAIVDRPGEILAAVAPVEQAGFALHPNVIQRMRVPDTVADALKPWYPLRGFYVEKEIRDFALLRSPALVEEIARGYRACAPLYQMLCGIVPVELEG